MITRGISSCNRSLPKYICEAIVEEGLGYKATITTSYRLIARYFIHSSLHLRKEPCCCITMRIQRTACIAHPLINLRAQCL